ncbi:FkbM family methyltransferase [Nitrobacteraceae bacterium AZCC 2146]
MISYAQNFEDVMLARVFAGRDSGFYVDVGAADPVNLSVTKWFYDLGWNGLNIEPNRQLFDRLATDRPRDISLDCGVGAIASEAQFFELEVGELSSFDPSVKEYAASNGTSGSTRNVAIFPLTDLLAQHGQGRHIDFLKIDVEGWEHEVLKGLDLRQYRPTIIVVEATVPESRELSHQEWEPLVLGANYSFVYFDGVNRFYLANEHADLKMHFTSPPNAFDEFETFPLVRAKADAAERLEAMHKLESSLIECEADRGARLVAIHQLEGLLSESESDRAARLAAMNELERMLSESDRDRAARLAAIHQLEKSFSESEHDRAARLAVIHELQKVISEAEQNQRARPIHLTGARSMLRYPKAIARRIIGFFRS